MLLPRSSILVLGSGGREHALARKLSDSPLEPRVFVAPGHDGIARDERVRGTCVPLSLEDHDALVKWCHAHAIALTIVGPELPLSQGIVDRFRREGLRIIGPTQDSAQLEASKIHAKQIMDAAHIPTATWRHFQGFDEALEAMASASFPCVLKADGLAAGKGAFVVDTMEEARDVLHALMIERTCGDAGARVLCEELLIGEELSYIVLTDGAYIKPLATSKDYKRLRAQDRGPNTGGMGAVTPSPDMTPELERCIHDEILEPLLAQLRAQHTPYSGFLYVGLMLTARGPRVLEFNVRLGDPETQALLWGMDADLLPALWALAVGEFAHDASDLSKGMPAVCVVSASAGYPAEPSASVLIRGLEEINSADVMVCHAGVRLHEERLYTRGGRVLSVTARAQTLSAARALAYAQTRHVVWEGIQRREDIGGGE